MKKFVLSFSLIFVLSSCTYNTYIVKKDEFMKDIKHEEVKHIKDSITDKRDEIIQYCQQKGGTTCYFLKKNGIEHMVMFLQNENVLNFYHGKITNLCNAFCSSSNVRRIPAKFHIILLEPKLARNFDCLTGRWDDWYLTEKHNNDRY